MNVIGDRVEASCIDNKIKPKGVTSELKCSCGFISTFVAASPPDCLNIDFHMGKFNFLPNCVCGKRLNYETNR